MGWQKPENVDFFRNAAHVRFFSNAYGGVILADSVPGYDVDYKTIISINFIEFEKSVLRHAVREALNSRV
jgi:hypothetical protein